jgi:hypothetical protein
MNRLNSKTLKQNKKNPKTKKIELINIIVVKFKLRNMYPPYVIICNYFAF